MNRAPGRRRPRKKVAGRRAAAREWAERWLGHAAVAVGWMCVLPIVFLSKAGGNAVAIVELGYFGAVAFGFGLCWLIRTGGGGRRE